MRELAKVKDRKNLRRDMNSKAIINVDEKALKDAKMIKDRINRDRVDNQKTQERVEFLTNQLRKLEKVVEGLLEKIEE